MSLRVLRGCAVAASSLVLASMAGGQQPAVVSAPTNACASLQAARLPDVRISEVVDAPDSLAHGDNVRAPHCRVSGVIGKEIAFVVLLPNKWNQRLLMGGNGGFAGSINRGILANATVGYVTVSTNTGHEDTGDGARWAFNNTERQINYGYAGVHRTVEVAKVLTKLFYGSEPKYSYFNGCSNGGRQALMEVQRYPDDFDGVIAGAPAISWTTIGSSFLKNTQAVYPTPAHFDRPLVTSSNLDLLSAKILEACDAIDGVKDGVLDDPRDCKFKLASLRSCPGDKSAADCLTSVQRKAIAAIYAPTLDEKHRVVYPGQPLGGENLPGGWTGWIVGRDSGLMKSLHVPSAQAMFSVEAAKYIVFSDTTWDYSRYHGSLAKDAARFGEIGNADDPNISGFTSRKGRLILYHGWADPALNPLATIDYYEKALSADSKARDYVRLFMLPGVLHCGGGNGPADVPWLRTVVEWVEQNRTPEQLVATKRQAGKVTRTRPICAYPKRAVYSGQGSTDDASSFVCRDPGA
jgi:feruloyl esterase